MEMKKIVVVCEIPENYYPTELTAVESGHTIEVSTSIRLYKTNEENVFGSKHLVEKFKGEKHG